MRHVAFILAISSSCTAFGFASPRPQQLRSAEKVAGLVKQLGSTKFVERDKAMKELDALGPGVLPLLRPALQSPNAEVRSRVEMLVRKFEDHELAVELRKGKRVHLKLNEATIYEAAAELSKQSYPVKVPPELQSRSDIKISLDTGETTFWEALHQIGMKITEADPKTQPTEKKPSVTKSGIVPKGAPVRSVIIPFGHLVSKPVCFAGSVRVMLLQTAVQPNGDLDLKLEVAYEPNLLEFDVVASPRVDRAVDANDRAWTAKPHSDAPPPPVVDTVLGHPVQRIVPPQIDFRPPKVLLRLGASGQSGAKSFSEISGVISVATLVESEPRFVVDDIVKALGKAVKGPEGVWLTVYTLVKTPDGEVIVEMVLENDAAHSKGMGATIRMPAGTGRSKKNDAWRTQGAKSALRLYDASGAAFQQLGIPGWRTSIGAEGKTAHTEVIVFAPNPGQGGATRLLVPGYRRFSFEAPFTFKDVSVPSR